MIQRLAIQVVLARDVIMQAGLGDARAICDTLGGRAPQAILGKFCNRTREDQLPHFRTPFEQVRPSFNHFLATLILSNSTPLSVQVSGYYKR